VYTGQCPVLQGRAALELASFGNSQRLVRYNSPDMSGVHRTVRCDIEAMDTSAPTATCSAWRAEVRHAHTGAPDTLQYMSVFRDRGVPGPTSEMSPRAPAQMGRREVEHEGGKKVAGDGRERGGNPAAFVFVPHPGRVRLQ
jgi:hypothetical protein